MAAPFSSSSVSISDSFDSGNIRRVPSSSDDIVNLEIKDDVFTELEACNHKQWFYFKSAFRKPLTEPTSLTYSIVNAGKASFPTAWPGTTIFFSYDRRNWRRALTTDYDKENGVLKWVFAHEKGSRGVYFSECD